MWDRILVFCILERCLYFVGASTSVEYSGRGNLSLPQEWIGSWSRGDRNDAASSVIIEKWGISMGNDYHYYSKLSDPNFYIFQEIHGEAEPCFRCLFITQKHPNVLYFRQSDCNVVFSIEDCENISPSAPFVLLVRDEAKSEPCPIGNSSMNFDYNSGRGLCTWKESGSRVTPCSHPGMLSLEYEACVDSTEKINEVLTCVGSWQENSYNYFIARVSRRWNRRQKTEGFRCFNYLPETESTDTTESVKFYASRSGDIGSCSQALSPTEGAWTYRFYLAEKETRAPFPSWLGSSTEDGISRWTAMNLTFQFLINASEGEIRMLPLPSLSNDTKSSPYQFICSKIDFLNETYAALQVTQIVRCKSIPICMDLYKRSDNVVEFELYHRLVQPNQRASCHHQVKVNPHLTYTLVKKDPDPIKCPLSGVYFTHRVPFRRIQTDQERNCKETAGRTQNLKYHLHIGCNQTNSDETGLEFYVSCHESGGIVPSKHLKFLSRLDCISSWTENEKIYLVATNSMLQVPGYRCFQFTPAPDGYIISTAMDDCKPSFHQDFITWKFSIAMLTPCNGRKPQLQASTESSSTTISKWNLTPLVLGVIFTYARIQVR